MLHISENIKKARELTELSQADFAYIIGVGRTTYAEWENGIVPKAHFFSRISAVSGVPMDEILATTDEELDGMKKRALEKKFQMPVIQKSITVNAKPKINQAAAAKLMALQELIIELFSVDKYKPRSEEEIRAALGSKVNEILNRKDEMDTLSGEDK